MKRRQPAGFTLIQMTLAIAILALMGAVALLIHSRNASDKQFATMFDIKYLEASKDPESLRNAVLSKIISFGQQSAYEDGRVSQIDKELKQHGRSTPAEVMECVGIMDKLNAAQAKASVARAAYGNVLKVAYQHGYRKETLALGYVPPRCGCL